MESFLFQLHYEMRCVCSVCVCVCADAYFVDKHTPWPMSLASSEDVTSTLVCSLNYAILGD